MNRFLERLADLYAPLGRRGLLMDGHYRFAPDTGAASGSRSGGQPVKAVRSTPRLARSASLALRIAHPFHR
ncbi:hypothetical protein QFZ41_001907 [Luteibacter sp. W1I16]|jgi:hypothetical protein|uniref:hypothetical protein n=1 Tax=Luteibacter sp. W1I16 TaxID=3373922 RepID=UPI003D22877B